VTQPTLRRPLHKADLSDEFRPYPLHVDTVTQREDFESGKLTKGHSAISTNVRDPPVAPPVLGQEAPVAIGTTKHD
jgi:hypothetical protein